MRPWLKSGCDGPASGCCTWRPRPTGSKMAGSPSIRSWAWSRARRAGAACLSRGARGSEVAPGAFWHAPPFRATVNLVSAGRQIVVCDGDETGQELLNEALRVLDPGVLGFDVDLLRFDLSLGNRRATGNQVVRDAAAAMRETGLGLKAATITPETTGDVGSPNPILREGVNGSVIVRTGRRIPGVPPPASVVHPIVVVRMAVGDAYGAEERRTGDPGGAAEQAWRTEHIERSTCRAVAEYSFRTAALLDACV